MQRTTAGLKVLVAYALLSLFSGCDLENPVEADIAFENQNTFRAVSILIQTTYYDGTSKTYSMDPIEPGSMRSIRLPVTLPGFWAEHPPYRIDYSDGTTPYWFAPGGLSGTKKVTFKEWYFMLDDSGSWYQNGGH